MQLKKYSVLPGFGLAGAFTLSYMLVIVLIPLGALFFKTAELSPSEIWSTLTEPRVLASFKLSIGTAALAAGINAIFGIIIAWTLVRYEFPGKRIADALIDLPFALPTAVAGIALTTLYAPKGPIGQLLLPYGIKIAYTWIGITIALIFIGLPFVVRSVQPVLADLDRETEEAAASLGARRWQTIYKVILPSLLPAVLSGFALAFARAVGEYGSVVFISGNMPMKTEITPLLIITKLEQYEYAEATAIATAMLVFSFGILLVLNLVQRWAAQRHLA